MDFKSILKYVAMANPTQQYSYKQGCGVGVLIVLGDFDLR